MCPNQATASRFTRESRCIYTSCTLSLPNNGSFSLSVFYVYLYCYRCAASNLIVAFVFYFHDNFAFSISSIAGVLCFFASNNISNSAQTNIQFDLSHVLQSQQRKAFKSVCNLSPHSHNLLIPQTENISNMLLIGCEIGHIRMLQVFAFNRKSNKPNKKYLFRKIYLYIPTSKECKRTRRTR